jgi:hypothetical protein
MRLRSFHSCWIALVLLAGLAVPAAAAGDNDFPYSIMTPEREPARHHGAPAHHANPNQVVSPQGDARPPVWLRATSPRHMARGSSGSVLPTPLPRTPLIAPENRNALTVQPLPQEQQPTFLPGLKPVPNLPHGPESFQDRASRCAFQTGLYGVPNGVTGQYMHACSM